MLRENNLAVRLMSQLAHLQRLKEYDYCCELCGIAIVCSSHLLSMSTDGPFFVNPTGDYHSPFEQVNSKHFDFRKNNFTVCDEKLKVNNKYDALILSLV